MAGLLWSCLPPTPAHSILSTSSYLTHSLLYFTTSLLKLRLFFHSYVTIDINALLAINRMRMGKPKEKPPNGTKEKFGHPTHGDKPDFLEGSLGPKATPGIHPNTSAHEETLFARNVDLSAEVSANPPLRTRPRSSANQPPDMPIPKRRRMSYSPPSNVSSAPARFLKLCN